MIYKTRIHNILADFLALLIKEIGLTFGHLWPASEHAPIPLSAASIPEIHYPELFLVRGSVEPTLISTAETSGHILANTGLICNLDHFIRGQGLRILYRKPFCHSHVSSITEISSKRAWIIEKAILIDNSKSDINIPFVSTDQHHLDATYPIDSAGLDGIRHSRLTQVRLENIPN